jgi:glutaredoxin
MFCGRTEEFLRENDVEFSIRDITQDEEAFEELERLGTMTTPVTLVGKEVIVGFDRERLRGEIGF